MDVMTGYEMGMMLVSALVICGILLVAAQLLSNYLTKKFPPLG